MARMDAGYSATRDALMDAKDMIPVTINQTSSAVQGIAGLGSVIGLFVAPVPTVLGLLLLEVVSGAISESTEGKGRAPSTESSVVVLIVTLHC